MVGYFNKPTETREVIDAEGWFKTGDIGSLDAQGFLTITDRKKDLLKLSNGKYVAPQQIEALLRESELIEQAVVVGDRRKYPVALLVPNFENLRSFAQKKGISDGDLAGDPNVVEHLRKLVDAMTRNLADYERVKKIAVLPKEFTIEGGELTPTLKVRRRVVEEKYRDVIDSLYPPGERQAASGE
jgi:long-chain acyl-CoA synthetase